MAVERVERKREREKARGRGVGHALPVAIRNCSSPFFSLRHGLILSLSLFISLSRTRGGSHRRQTATWRSRSRRAWPWLLVREVAAGGGKSRARGGDL